MCEYSNQVFYLVTKRATQHGESISLDPPLAPVNTVMSRSASTSSRFFVLLVLPAVLALLCLSRPGKNKKKHPHHRLVISFTNSVSFNEFSMASAAGTRRTMPSWNNNKPLRNSQVPLGREESKRERKKKYSGRIIYFS